MYVQTFQDQEDISQPSDQVSDEPVLDTSVSPATKDIVASEESENKPEECGSIDNYEEKTTSDEEEHSEKSEELETAADDFCRCNLKNLLIKNP